MELDELPEMLDHYFYLESSFIDVVQIIPLGNNGRTYSPKLYDILQSTCSHFESLLKMIYAKLEFPSPQKSGIIPYYKSINEYGLLSGQILLFHKYKNGKFFYLSTTDRGPCTFDRRTGTCVPSGWKFFGTLCAWFVWRGCIFGHGCEPD